MKSFLLAMRLRLSLLSMHVPRLPIEGVQVKMPQNIPLGHKDHFKLKVIKTQQMQEKLSASPITA